MRTWIRLIVVVLMLACAGLVFGQAAQNQPPQTAMQTSPSARLSYKSNLPVGFGDPGFPQVCFALAQDGRYLMWRMTTRAQAETLAGRLKQDQRRQFQELLDGLAELPGSGAILLHRTAQAFVADLGNRQNIKRRSWVANRQNPFPAPIAKIVGWLQEFKPERTEPIKTNRQSICPAGRFTPLEPSVSGKDKISG